ncbi:hypothetical protein BDF20DRAFT_865549 [Mycotypha africana]|uniref:uncharacterized protein n=1 Tax=Mycotypha africana TaxID=64632 RepID=UPI0022FFF5F9|nr:uncharacterized protein BDF20DRAFT_865549 [Mycotypha africana]KAI8982200.1 hypothetical protein BDF20DRAFT_865549 [Mycotypha africana]
MIELIHKVEDVALSFDLAPDFRGILKGFANDVSEGCTLNGTLVMTIRQRTRVKRLETVFAGLCQVHFKTTNGIGVPTTDRTERRGIFLKRITHFDEYSIQNDEGSSIRTTLFEPGVYKFPFSFAIPATLPHSFKGNHGSIEYQLIATAGRSAFVSDLHLSIPIVLRRCLMNDLSPIARTMQTVTGTKNAHIASYSATAPSMVYSEGGLLELDFHVTLKDPARFSVRMITCGLKEIVSYRTTGKSSLTNQRYRYDETSYPLGCSTFFPSEHPDYNPYQPHNYNAIFRLYPKIHTDNRSKLIAVKHMLTIRMIVGDNRAVKGRRRMSESDGMFTRATNYEKGKGRRHSLPMVNASNHRKNSFSPHLNHPLSFLTHLSSKIKHQQHDRNAHDSTQLALHSTSFPNNANDDETIASLETYHPNTSSSSRVVPLTLNVAPTVSGAISTRNRARRSDMHTLNALNMNRNNTATEAATMTQTQSVDDMVRISDYKFRPRSQRCNERQQLSTTEEQLPSWATDEHSMASSSSSSSSSSSLEEEIANRGQNLSINNHYNFFHHHRNSQFLKEEGSYECELKLPVIVTSREEYREGDVPALPDYQSIGDEPPSYQSAIHTLPPVPVYPTDQNA